MRTIRIYITDDNGKLLSQETMTLPDGGTRLVVSREAAHERLIAERREAERKYDRLQRKAKHGCYDVDCPLCDAPSVDDIDHPQQTTDAIGRKLFRI